MLHCHCNIKKSMLSQKQSFSILIVYLHLVTLSLTHNVTFFASLMSCKVTFWNFLYKRKVAKEINGFAHINTLPWFRMLNIQHEYGMNNLFQGRIRWEPGPSLMKALLAIYIPKHLFVNNGCRLWKVNLLYMGIIRTLAPISGWKFGAIYGQIVNTVIRKGKLNVILVSSDKFKGWRTGGYCLPNWICPPK